MKRLSLIVTVLAGLSLLVLGGRLSAQQSDTTRIVLDAPDNPKPGATSYALTMFQVERGTVDPATGVSSGCDGHIYAEFRADNGDRRVIVWNDQQGTDAQGNPTCDAVATRMFRALNRANFSTNSFLSQLMRAAAGQIPTMMPVQPLPAGTVQ